MKFPFLPLTAFALLLFNTSAAQAQSFTDVAVGGSHICALTDTADVTCTTASFAERLDAPEGLPQMIDIAAGDEHTCGIDLEGNAVCWGPTENAFDSTRNFGHYDQLDVPAIDQPLESIAAGNNHTCAVDINGRAWCWGLNTNKQTEPPGDGWGENGEGFLQVSAGLNFSCGIQANLDIACWTTDFSRLPAMGGIVPGPFIDIDTTHWTACGLKEDGSIECWSRFDIEPPQNGPYSDLVVSPAAICGIDELQVLDCTYRPAEGVQVLAPIPGDTQFVKVESGMLRFRGTRTPFCGITINGDIECANNGETLPAPPSMASSTGQDLASVDVTLDVARYSTNSVELFWPILPQRFGRDQLFVEVFRNDELLTTTDANASWLDRTQQTQNVAVYRIRVIDQRGNVGPFSEPVEVNINTGEVMRNDGVSNFAIVQPAVVIESLRFVRSGATVSLVWSGPVPSENGFKGYQVSVNNTPVGFNDGFRLRLTNYRPQDCNIVSVAAMKDDGSILGFRSITANRFSNQAVPCLD